MPKVKSKQFPPVKVTEEFLTETKRCAVEADEYLSDYIRKAVEVRNSLGKTEKKTVTMEAAEDLQPMELVAEKDGKAVKADKPLSKGYCNPIPKGK